MEYLVQRAKAQRLKIGRALQKRLPIKLSYNPYIIVITLLYILFYLVCMSPLITTAVVLFEYDLLFYATTAAGGYITGRVFLSDKTVTKFLKFMDNYLYCKR